MVRAGGKVIEAAGPELVSLAIVLEHHRALYHRMGLVRAVPVHGHMHLLRHSNQQLGCVGCFVIDAQNRDLRRVGTQFGDDRLPLQVSVSGAHRVRRGHARPACYPPDGAASMTAQEGQGLREG